MVILWPYVMKECSVVSGDECSRITLMLLGSKCDRSHLNTIKLCQQHIGMSQSYIYDFSQGQRIYR